MRITAKNFELTETLKAYAQKRLSGLDRFYDGLMDMELIMESERNLYKGELIMKVKGKTIKAQSKDSDPLKVIDDLKDIAKRELRRYKEKLKDHRG